jgi:sugar/nucleoside kinase (ribokinase family)
MTDAYEALCFGAICADLRLLLPRLPAPGEGVRVREARWRPGGNSLIEARALAGWGVRVALCGDALGPDAPGDMLAAALRPLGLDAHLRRDPAAATVVCHVMVTPDGQRTILALRPDGPPPELPPPELLACPVVSVTRYGPRSAEVAALARAAGATVVAGDATSPGDELARHADVIVTSAELLARQAPGVPVAAQMAALHAVRGAAVLVSDGPRPARALWAEGGELRTAEAAPPAVAARDTTGAGDTFRAAVVRGLLRRAPWPAVLADACAAASAAVAATAGA